MWKDFEIYPKWYILSWVLTYQMKMISQGKPRSKWLTKENLEEMAHKSDSDHHEAATLPLSLHIFTCTELMYYTLFPPNKHFVSLL